MTDPDGHRIELFTNHYQTIDMEDEPIRWQASDLSIGRWGTFPPVSWQQEGSAFAGSDIRRTDNQERPAVAVHAR